MLGHADVPVELPMKLNEFTAVCSDFQGTIASQSVSAISLNTGFKIAPLPTGQSAALWIYIVEHNDKN